MEVCRRPPENPSMLTNSLRRATSIFERGLARGPRNSPAVLKSGPVGSCSSAKVTLERLRYICVDQEPLVSIITPCLNAERFIARTIESVLAQDYPRIEYILM